MIYLCTGLLLFLGCHSLRMLAEPWRLAQIERLGELRWKAIFSLASGLGLALIILGYAAARTEPVLIWSPPVWSRHLAALLTLPAFVLIAAAYIPGTRIKQKLAHPMVLGTKLWAFAHLLANGTLADLLLFGSFLLWAIGNFRAARKRDRVAGVVRSAGPVARDLLAIAVGVSIWASFAFILHQPLIGVRPF